MIAIPVELNGEKKTFLLDSGAPKTIIKRSSSCRSQLHLKTVISGAKGVNNSSLSGMDIVKIKSLWILPAFKLIDAETISMNLSHLEAELDQTIHGLIGFDFLKAYDILFNYQALTLSANQTRNEFDTYRNEQFKDRAMDCSHSFHAGGPYSSHRYRAWRDKTLAMGIDSGAESNLLDDDLFAEFQSHAN